MEAFLLIKVCAKKDLGSTNTCANLYQINGPPLLPKECVCTY